MTSPPSPADAGQSADLALGLHGVRLTIGKEFTFEASHRLHRLPDGHKCARPHGHSYQVTVELAADELTGPGFVTDFGDLSPFGTYLDEHFDHRDLNDVLDVEPTSELLALHLARWFLDNVQPIIAGRLVAVTVSETRKTWARCTIGDTR
ncbi:6-pyruvoyl trahydropterin synthase family protein [Nonomuraea turcica]|uniref:6-pyruvoyl trahydropterin synthase family protein n=1 Tax=Nonomuraea sp. G32 TaxID=3067274 RepID=UPI00273C793D|nr:6-carboxytetrahydropterin synthase [Nonomuraea sp. G32]MDP4511755.1 6-carboxytetrahydropterin synthase [Nonomuraea sp. G32]